VVPSQCAKDGSYFYEAPDDHPKSEGYCFALNLRQGDCYLLDLAAVTTNHVDCSQATTNASSTAGVFKVALRLHGSMDQTGCDTGQKAMA
jgi:hypothetical protein